MNVKANEARQIANSAFGKRALQISVYSTTTGKSKVVPVLNLTPCHEDVLGKWKYSSMHT